MPRQVRVTMLVEVDGIDDQEQFDDMLAHWEHCVAYDFRQMRDLGFALPEGSTVESDNVEISIMEDVDAEEITEVWNDNQVQFPRLLSEIMAVCELTAEQEAELEETMDLTLEQINELFERAHIAFEANKERICPPNS